METDYYAVLGVARTASLKEIKKRYRALVQIWHPDKFLTPAEKVVAQEKTTALNEAYRTLSNAAQRAQYDQAQAASPPMIIKVVKPETVATESVAGMLQRREQKMQETLARLAQEQRMRAAYTQPSADQKILAELEVEIKAREAELAALHYQPPNTATAELRVALVFGAGFMLLRMMAPPGWVVVWIISGMLVAFYMMYLRRRQVRDAKIKYAEQLREKTAQLQALLAKKATLLEAVAKSYMPGLGV